VSGAQQPGCVVVAPPGRVRGREENGVFAFRGVPYAAAPVGPRRLKPPAPPGRWHGALDARAFGPRAPQLRADPAFEQLFGSTLPAREDNCLTLNVWTPAPGATGLPVLVWLHSGGYVTGSGSDDCYPGANFARDGVVVVSVNYRLGCLGWLYLDELFEGAAGTGNLGLLDQLAALEWVQENIAAFGGDPSNVTLGGISAGGGCVTALLSSPRASGLFRRGIVQSGAGIRCTQAATARRAAQRFLEIVGVDAGDWDALRSLGVQALLSGQRQLYGEAGGLREHELLDRPGGLRLVFQPVLDGMVMREQPIAAAAGGRSHRGELLIGTTTDEWRLFCFLDQSREEDPSIARICAIETELSFARPARSFATARAAHNPETFVYRFAWASSARRDLLKACHGVDLPFVFDDLGGRLGSQLAAGAPPELARAVHAAWLQFVITGRPRTPDRPWKPYPEVTVIDQDWTPTQDDHDARNCHTTDCSPRS
jgi:para-nitrobenzyl esterase